MICILIISSGKLLGIDKIHHRQLFSQYHLIFLKTCCCWIFKLNKTICKLSLFSWTMAMCWWPEIRVVLFTRASLHVTEAIEAYQHLYDTCLCPRLISGHLLDVFHHQVRWHQSGGKGLIFLQWMLKVSRMYIFSSSFLPIKPRPISSIHMEI